MTRPVAIGVLIFLHRWLGMAFCLLFAMWFASGIVMHFVPYPSFTAADRRAGLAAIDLARVKASPSEAVAASRIGNSARARLTQRSDGPAYLLSNSSTAIALHADDLSEAEVVSAELARTIAADYAARRQRDAAKAGTAVLQEYDQWTLSAEFDRYRPLYRVALGDPSGTDLYVSKITGEVVQATTHRQRVWNYAGSVAHWIYLPALRARPAAWSRLVWWLSLRASIAAALGACVGIFRIEVRGLRLTSPYAGLHAWHHWLGLGCMLFVLTWMFSGWLSMDDGMLFSTDRPSDPEIAALAGISIRKRPKPNGSPSATTSIGTKYTPLATSGSLLTRHPRRRRFANAPSSTAEQSMPPLRSPRQAARSPFLLDTMTYMPQRRIDRRSKSFGLFAATFGSTSTARTAPYATDSTGCSAPIGGSSTHCIGWIFSA